MDQVESYDDLKVAGEKGLRRRYPGAKTFARNRRLHCVSHADGYEEHHENREQVKRAENCQKTFRRDVRDWSEDHEQCDLKDHPDMMGLQEFNISTGFARPGMQRPQVECEKEELCRIYEFHEPGVTPFLWTGSDLG